MGTLVTLNLILLERTGMVQTSKPWLYMQREVLTTPTVKPLLYNKYDDLPYYFTAVSH
jgi:hypothetical protein